MSDIEKYNPEPTEPSVELEKYKLVQNEASLDNLSVEDLDSLIRKVAEFTDLGRLKLAELLSYMKRSKKYLEKTNNKTGEVFKTFEEYCSSIAKVEIRSCQYRVLVYDKLIKKLKVPAARIEKIGWSKAAQVASKATEFNLEGLMQRAEILSARDLTAELKEQKSGIAVDAQGERVVPSRTMMFKFTDDQYENILAAIENASLRCTSLGKSKALDMICLQYNADALFSSDSTHKGNELEWLISRMESTFNIKLAVVEDVE